MAVREWIPYDNVNVDDIRDTLNANGGNVDNDLASFFKDQANINPFARFKPTIYPAPFVDDDNRWKGKDRNCGIIAYRMDLGTVKSHLDANLCEWVYRLPSGGDTEPFRLGDFRGYQPVTGMLPPICVSRTSWDVNIEDNTLVTFTLDVETFRENERGLIIDDFENFVNEQGVTMPLSSMYFKYIIYEKGTTSFVASGSASAPITNEYDGTTISIDASDFVGNDLNWNGTKYFDVYLYLGNSDDSYRLSIPPWNGVTNVKYPLSLSVYHEAGSVWETNFFVGYNRDGSWMITDDMIMDDDTPIYFLQINPRYDNGYGWFKVTIKNKGTSKLDIIRSQLAFFWGGSYLEPFARQVTYLCTEDDKTNRGSVTLNPEEEQTFILGVDKCYFINYDESFSLTNIPPNGESYNDIRITHGDWVVASTITFPIYFNRDLNNAGGFIEA